MIPVKDFARKGDGFLRAACRRCARDMHLKDAYGVSLAEVDRLFAIQNGVCAICRKPETHHNQHGLTPLSVDHSHSTGAVRGLLCHVCNLAIGNMGEDPARLRAAADYLEKHSHVDPLRVLSPEEAQRVPPLSGEQIDAALAEGELERDALESLNH